MASNLLDLDTYFVHSKTSGRKERKLNHVVIFSNPNFKMGDFPKLSWVDKDTTAMHSFWSPYQVQLSHDHNSQEMHDKIQELSEKIDKRCSFLVLIFLTYGEHGIIYAKDKKVALQELLAPLKGDKCLHLAGKPKIIILQTTSPVLQADSDAPPATIEKTIPSEADFIYLWSRIPGEYGMADPKGSGSLFISTLISMMETHEGEPLTKIMRRTTSSVEQRLYAVKKEWLDKFQEVPFIVSQLRKRIVFS